MPTSRSGMSRQSTQGYWAAVRRLLQTSHQFSLAKSQRAIAAYKKELARYDIGDEIYHAPIEETANGVVNGEYGLVSTPRPRKSEKTTTATLTNASREQKKKRKPNGAKRIQTESIQEQSAGEQTRDAGRRAHS